MVSIDYLDDERKKLWNEIIQLKKSVDKKTSDYEREAKQSSKKASEYRNRSLEAKDLITNALSESELKLSEVKSTYNRLNGLLSEIEEVGNLSKETSGNIDSLQQKIGVVDKLFEDREDFDEKLNRLTEISEEGETHSSKIGALYTGLLKRKKEIDELYFEIAGYTDKNEETGEPVSVEGLRDKLEKSYSDIEAGLEILNLKLLKIGAKASNDYEEFIKSGNIKFGKNVESWKHEYSGLSKKVKELLPDALTAGLSHAFSRKREFEIDEGKRLSKIFFYAILGLVCVSLIPFAVNVYLLSDGKSLESVIFDMPRMLLAILPLYVPVLWVAYSASKKINLSKRLVEEYTHKEVLSKTFEGLSRQIEEIDNSEVSSELRIKLLYNILDVSSENPGKLISDYNKADHPLMDALDKSAKLSGAVESLLNIPGLSKLAKMLDRKSENILEKQTKKVEEALDSVSSETSNDVSNSEEKKV